MSGTRRFLVTAMVVLAYLLAATAARAATPFYVAAHVGGNRAVPDPHRFVAIVGYAEQCVAGIPCWRYVKGSRSPRADLPERWYVHVDGRRVHDAVFGYFVMDPARRGWERYVARACGARCFLDGLGPTSVKRTTPRLTWRVSTWVDAAAKLTSFVRMHGHRVLPNSIGKTRGVAREYLAASGGRGSTEFFDTATASWLLPLGHVWVQEIGGCVVKWAAYQRWTDGNDRFSCHEYGTRAWDLSWWSG